MTVERLPYFWLSTKYVKLFNSGELIIFNREKMCDLYYYVQSVDVNIINVWFYPAM